MNFEGHIKDYLSGLKFSNGLDVKIGTAEKSIISRFKLLDNLIMNKKIIHLGCCDHLELIEQKIKTNTWLHKRLTERAEKCLGIDINEAGINYLKQKHGYANIKVANILIDNLDELVTDMWDYLILGEILEHIDDPVRFLKIIRNRFNSNIARMIVTVPNAFCYLNTLNVNDNKELINSDHRYWFTPYTLAKVITVAGYFIEDFYFAQEIDEKIGMRAKLKVAPYIKRKFLYRRLKKFPGLRDTIVMIAKFK